MKCCIAIMTATFASISLGSIKTIEWTQTPENVMINVATIDHNHQCEMGLTAMEVVTPFPAFNESPRLNLTFEIIPDQMCAMAIGPHRGKTSIPKAILNAPSFTVTVNGVTANQKLVIHNSFLDFIVGKTFGRTVTTVKEKQVEQTHYSIQFLESGKAIHQDDENGAFEFKYYLNDQGYLVLIANDDQGILMFRISNDWQAIAEGSMIYKLESSI